MPPDYMGDAVTITMGAVAAATAPEITEEMYEQLDYLEKHLEENYYENEENFSQYAVSYTHLYRWPTPRKILK